METRYLTLKEWAAFVWLFFIRKNFSILIRHKGSIFYGKKSQLTQRTIVTLSFSRLASSVHKRYDWQFGEVSSPTYEANFNLFQFKKKKKKTWFSRHTVQSQEDCERI